VEDNRRVTTLGKKSKRKDYGNKEETGGFSSIDKQKMEMILEG
jgi:hypothetical protein